MNNVVMEQRLRDGEALDVRKIGKEIAPGKFELESFVDDVDYCDAQTETWIWSIGKHRETGIIIASYGTEYYQNDQYQCLWLR